MKLEQIITLANCSVRLEFLAMERSLRATGCVLPLRVIPYDDRTFDLPKNATWWHVPEILRWLRDRNCLPVMNKYQCLTATNYQFVDTDVCFLRNPAEVLSPFSGFVTACGHWHQPDETLTEESRGYAAARSTIWQSGCFNSGQFACDRALYTVESLRAVCDGLDAAATCLRHKYHEQPGLNLLVWRSGVEITNLTLPPVRMESTWAGDYGASYRDYWKSVTQQPYLIHWAGVRADGQRPIDQIFFEFLTASERAEWAAAASSRREASGRRMRGAINRVRHASKAFVAAWQRP